jgi:ABC-type branched-subunit amino acid transport system substrate-binding protein
MPQTGSYGPLALNQGHQLCVKHANEKGGVLGRRIELLVEDDLSEPAVAARIYQKLTRTARRSSCGPMSSRPASRASRRRRRVSAREGRDAAP